VFLTEGEGVWKLSSHEAAIWLASALESTELRR
jgi:hypothetical protein